MTARSLATLLVSVVVRFIQVRTLSMRLALVERYVAPYAIVQRIDSVAGLLVESAAGPSECASCKEERKKKNLPPMPRVRLPEGITDARNFRHPVIPTVVCAFCDGETLVNGALKAFAARQK